MSTLSRFAIVLAGAATSVSAQFSLLVQETPVDTSIPRIYATFRHGSTVLGFDDQGGTTLSWSKSGGWSATGAATITKHVFFTRAGVAMGWATSTRSLIEFDGSTWNDASWSGTVPTAEHYYCIAVMPNDDVILFGGIDSSSIDLAETWLLDTSNQWQRLTPSTSPSARSHAQMAPDGNGNLLLFGGFNSGSSTFFNDTWTFDGTSWTQLTPTTSPSARLLPGMALHADAGGVVMLGGLANPAPNDAWLFAGGNWTSIPGSYTISTNGAFTNGIAHDPDGNEIVLYNVDEQRTVLVGISGFVSFGTGCTCIGQTAPFTITSTGTARLNQPWSITFNNYTPMVPLAWVFDSLPAVPPVQWPGLAAGCMQYMANNSANVVLISLTPAAAPPATSGVQQLTSTALIGMRLVMQGVQPPWNGGGDCSSNAIDMRLGR